jgi:hypothetical protein
VVASYRFSGTAEPTKIKNFDERFEAQMVVQASVLRAVPPAGAMRAIALSMPPHACPREDRRRPTPCSFRRRRQRYKHASVVKRPPQSHAQRLGLVEGASARWLTFHCDDKAGYMYSSPLHICRVVLLLLRQRRGAGLGELQLARGRSKYFATAPAHTQRVLCTVPKHEKLEY